MKTFCVQTLGCKVNHYESEQLSALLRARGPREVDPQHADLRVVNTCSVTIQAASKSRQSTRRLVRLPVLNGVDAFEVTFSGESGAPGPASDRPRVIVTGCWATSDRGAAEALPGVDAVLTHHQDVAAELDRLLTAWLHEPNCADARNPKSLQGETPSSEPRGNEGWMIEAGTPYSDPTSVSKPAEPVFVNEIPIAKGLRKRLIRSAVGTTSLPLLGARQSGRQRAFIKIQDGCDAHCTYCIIPTLRPRLWSKSIDDVVREADALVAAGHVEIVLTGIFLGAYGQATALRRRQGRTAGSALEQLVDALCTRVPGLRRLRLSSLEPGDLTPQLLAVLRSHAQVAPHFHLPLQSGSDELLRRMNRQYSRDDFLRMLDSVRSVFDRPALTTDVIVGFPGESDAHFAESVEVVRRAGFIHVHAFPFSPRPGTAAGRWTGQFVHGPVVNDRINMLTELAREQSFRFRQHFVGETVQLLVEHDSEADDSSKATPRLRHGRAERYFTVSLNDPTLRPGDFVRARIHTVTLEATLGDRIDSFEAVSA